MPLPALLTRLRERAAAVADRASRGSAVPAGSEPEQRPADAPSSRERGAMRRRARALRRRREALLLELGALAYELRRHERGDSGLLDAKVAELRALDDEERALATALGERRPLLEVVRAGIAGTCESCGSLVGTGDRFCARCGTELPAGRRGRRAKDADGAAEVSPAGDAVAPAEPTAAPDDAALDGSDETAAPAGGSRRTADAEPGGDATPGGEPHATAGGDAAAAPAAGEEPPAAAAPAAGDEPAAGETADAAPARSQPR